MSGSYYNFPENNCCSCGFEITLTNTAPSSTFGCTHTKLNSISKPLIQYCNEVGITKAECEEKDTTLRGHHCQWIPCK